MARRPSASRRRSAPPPDGTRTRILDAAERLFAARGIDAVSVRAVLEEAGVNTALANYHFGGREGLIEALVRDRVTPILDEQARALDAVEARGPGASLEDVLRAYFGPMARLAAGEPGFGRVLGQLTTSPNPDIRALGRRVMWPSLARLAESILRHLPRDLEPRRLLLRFNMVVGVYAHFGVQWDAVADSARRRLVGEAPLDGEVLVDELVAFCAAGLRIPPLTRGRGRT